MKQEIRNPVVSVITSIYNGNQFIPKLCEMIERNVTKLSKDTFVEFILINDSPWISMQVPEWTNHYDIRCFVNEENIGIHASRIRGITESRGEYILLLDQDDEIADDYLVSQLQAIGKASVVVANGIKEFDSFSKVIYRDKLKMKLVNHKSVYALAANQIVSPGQCLIRKRSIPFAWLQNALVTNGSDDLFLWLLYLSSGERFNLNYNLLYTHKQVGTNLSNDLQKMCDSDKEMCELARRAELMPLLLVKKRERMVKFLEDSNYTQKLTLPLLFKYPDVVFVKLISYYI